MFLNFFKDKKHKTFDPFKIEACSPFPQWITLNFLKKLPVTVASGERSFSKMAEVKNKFRNSTKQDTLVSPSMLANKHKMPRTINFESIIDTFAQTKDRRVPL